MMLPSAHLRRCSIGGTARLVTSAVVPSTSTYLSPNAPAPSSISFTNNRCIHATPSLGSVMRKRPLMENFERRLLRAMTEPVYPKEVLYPVKVKALTPYQEFRVEWLKYMKWLVDGALERNEVFGFYYCTKPDNRREFNQMQQTFRQAGLMLNDWKAEDMRIVLEGTKYENLRTILNDNVLFCHPYEHFSEGMPKDYVPPPKADNMTAVKEMIRLGRVVPLVTLLGGLIEDELVTRSRMMEYTELGTIDSQRGQFCGLLSSIPSTTSSLLSHHQNILSATLSSYVSEQSKSLEQPTVEGGDSGGGVEVSA